MLKLNNFFLSVIFVLAITSIGSYTANAQVTYVDEKFDAAAVIPPGWSVQEVIYGGSGTHPTWVVQTPVRTNAMPAYSSPYVAQFNSYDTPAGNQARLITPSFNFTTASTLEFKFQWLHLINSAGDGMDVEVSTDGGTTWSLLASYATSAVTPNEWQLKTIDISAYIGASDVKFAFKGKSNYGNVNVTIDNVVIGMPPADDMGITAITSPGSSAFKTPTTVTAIVKNFGLADRTAGSYNVISKIWKTSEYPSGTPVFDQTEAGPELLAGASVSFSFATQWTPAEYVGYTAEVYTVLAGDLNSTNDAMTKVVTVIPATDLQILSVVYPLTTNLYTGTLGYSVRAQVRNNGTSTSGTAYTVEAWIGLTAGFPGSATYHHSATFLPDIAAGATVNVDIPDSWVPVDPGLHTVRFKVTLAGDEISSNDQLDVSRTVLSVHFGGPDGGGYYYITDASTNAAKPTYNWLDITGVGTPLNFTSDDENSADITIPSFTLYGNAYTSLKVNNNGMIRFDGSANSSYYNNPGIPSTTVPNYLLAPFWDDAGLVAGTTNIYYYNDAANNQFIIEYYQLPAYGQTTNFKTFEVVLNYSTNSIFFQYNTMPGNLGGSTVGIEGSGAATMGTQWLYNNLPSPAADALVSGRVIYFGTSSTTVPVIASLTPFYTLDVTATNGAVVKNPNQASYASGTSVILTATADPGYSFTGWSGDASGSDNPLTVIMDGNKNITATFTLIATAPVWSISATSLSFGDVSISLNAAQTLTVTNTGTAQLDITSAASSDPQFTVSPASANVAIGESQIFTVTFTPGSVGNQSALITFTHNADGSPSTVSATGVGVLNALLSFYAAKDTLLDDPNNVTKGIDLIYSGDIGIQGLQFTIVGPSGLFTINSASRGAAIADVNDWNFTTSLKNLNPADGVDSILILIYGKNYASLSTGTYNSLVLFNFNVRDVVKDTSGSFSIIDIVSAQANNWANAAGVLAGIGTVDIFIENRAPVYVVDTDNINFGDINAWCDKEESFTVTNEGTRDMTITATSNGDWYTVIPVGPQVIPQEGGEQTFTVKFAPDWMDSTKSKNKTITLYHDGVVVDGEWTENYVAVTGRAINGKGDVAGGTSSIFGDGKVNVIDVNKTVGYITGNPAAALTGRWFANADVYFWQGLHDSTDQGDGLINIQDIVLMSRAIANEQWPDAQVLYRPSVLPSNDNDNQVIANKVTSTDVFVTFIMTPTAIFVDMVNIVPVMGIQMKLHLENLSGNVQPVILPRASFMTQDYNVNQSNLTHLMYNLQGQSVAGGEGMILKIPYAGTDLTQLTILDLVAGGNAYNNLSVGYRITFDPTFVDETVEIPTEFDLKQNYPNPFNPTTSIKFAVPEPSGVTLSIYTMLGQEVRTLVSGQMEAGSYSVSWDGKDNSGRIMSSGAYIYRMIAGSFIQTRKMMLLK